MEGPDYQFALLLQRQLEYENDNDTDLYLARSLQEDFNKEVETENPVTLVYDQKKKSENDARSLVDPSWELVDPTPNIYNLFVAFNQRFFWNNLVTVCVSWSKRMTSCAGICSYQGKGGMCSITLSEPLLKLRPRKDLVETLLHEMIHAYLFVTHNNKDRDGHGTEFHKHMFRINKEAGTNITVYHSFHDEVRLYKQHWWRCNGACQNRRPYFGMVRRATNRAPGPYDRWWNEHTRTCGGVFVKVREPEKKTANQKGNKQVQKTPSAGDIRKFLPNLNDNSTTKPTRNSDNYSHKESINGFNGLNNSTQNTTKLSQVPSNIHGLSNLTRSQNSTTDTISKGNTNSNNYSHKGSTNINGFNDLNNFTQTTTKVSQVSGNIHGLSNLRKPQNSTTGTVPKGNTNNRVVNIGNATKTKSNSNSTIIVNKKPNTVDVNESSETTKAVVDVFAGIGSCLTSPDKLNNERYNDDYSVVRNHWLNKFPVVPDNVNKRNNSSLSTDESSKKRKTQSAFNQSTTSSSIISESMVGCPVCENQIKESLINSHLDSCLQEQSTKNINTKQLSPICNKDTPENHVDNRLNEKNNNEEQIECEICNMLFNKGSIETHRRLCIEEAFSKSSPSFNQDFPVIPNNLENAVILAHCPVCDEFIDTQEINSHKAECLLNAYDDLDNKYNLKSSYEEIKCLVCSKKLPKNELNAHLDDCMGNVFDVKNDFNLCSNSESNTNGSCSGNCDKKNITKYNCPFCMELYSELDMSAHLDECLISDVDDNSNKSILIDSFSNKDIF